jgi:hypothetical protein
MSTGRQLSIGMTWSCPVDFRTQLSEIEKYLPTVNANFTFERNPDWSNPFMSRSTYMQVFGATLLIVWMCGWVLYFDLIRRMPNHLINVNERSRGMMPPQIPNKSFRVRLYYYIPVLTAFSDAATLGLNYMIPFHNAISKRAIGTNDTSDIPSWLPSFMNVVNGFLIKYEENGPFWFAVGLCTVGFVSSALVAEDGGTDETEMEAREKVGEGQVLDDSSDSGDDDSVLSVEKDGASPSIAMTLRDLVFSTGSFFVLTHLLSALQCECFEEDSCPVLWPTPPIAVLVQGPTGATTIGTSDKSNLCLGTNHAVYIFVALTLAVPVSKAPSFVSAISAVSSHGGSSQCVAQYSQYSRSTLH